MNFKDCNFTFLDKKIELKNVLKDSEFKYKLFIKM